MYIAADSYSQTENISILHTRRYLKSTYPIRNTPFLGHSIFYKPSSSLCWGTNLFLDLLNVTDVQSIAWLDTFLYCVLWLCFHITYSAFFSEEKGQKQFFIAL